MDDEKDLFEDIEKNLEHRVDLEEDKARRDMATKEKRQQQREATAEKPEKQSAAEHEKVKTGTVVKSKQTKESEVPENKKNTQNNRENQNNRNSQNGKKKRPTQDKPEVEVIIEEYQDPEDAPLPSERGKKHSSSRRYEDDYDEPAPRRKKRKRKHRLLKFLIKLVIIVLILVFGIHFALMQFVSSTDYQPYETDYVRADDVMTSKWVENVLVIGTDARNTDSNSRSDCIIIVSINKKSGKLVMTSILRDSYVTIPGYGENRINAAYQFGGAALLIQTIEENFKIGIDHYVKVDFFSFINIIDAIGGVEIEVDDGEAQYVNQYLCEINNLLGVEQGDGNLTSTGTLTLSGKQALAYSRIRYIGTDFARTGRQREVINAMISKAKTLDPLTLISVVSDVLPELTTDISDSDMAWLIMQAPLWLTYDTSEGYVPADGTWSDYTTAAGAQVLSIDFAANIEILQSTIYEGITE